MKLPAHDVEQVIAKIDHQTHEMLTAINEKRSNNVGDASPPQGKMLFHTPRGCQKVVGKVGFSPSY
jgi:hypothetical protein